MSLARQGPLSHMLANAKPFVAASSLLFFASLIMEVVNIAPPPPFIFALYSI